MCIRDRAADMLSWYYQGKTGQTAYYMLKISNFAVFFINYLYMLHWLHNRKTGTEPKTLLTQMARCYDALGNPTLAYTYMDSALSLIHIYQMKRPAYDSPSLPITWDRMEYVEGTNEYVRCV